MHDLYPNNRYRGEILLDQRHNILSPTIDPIEVRMRIGMAFQKPNPFPKSVYENVAYGLRVQGRTQRSDLDEKVEAALKSAALWHEVKDRLKEPAFNLSGGQQRTGDPAPANARTSARSEQRARTPKDPVTAQDAYGLLVSCVPLLYHPLSSTPPQST